MTFDYACESAGSTAEADLALAMAMAARELSKSENVPVALSQIVWMARDLIPGAEHVGVSVASRSGIETVASSDAFVNRLDQLQYELNEGPCLDAMAGHTQAVVTNMRTETRWPRFAPLAFAEGVVSQMGIEVFHEGSSAGGLNMYSSHLDAFDDHSRHAATLLAMHVAIVMGKVITVTELTDALQSRQVIGQAIGIVMNKYTVDEQAAFAYLARLSQNTNVKLREIATQIVRDASTKALSSRGVFAQ